MSFRASIIYAVGLASIASALPSGATTTYSSLQAREECPSGTWFSKCYDIEGCFNYDPCVAGTPEPTCTSGENTSRGMYALSVRSEDYSERVSYFQVQYTEASQSELKMVGVFGGIPADAKKCSVWWRGNPEQRKQDFRTFAPAGDNMKAQLVQVDGLDASEGMPWGVVKNAPELGGAMTVDMGVWKDSTVSWDRPIGELAQCSEEIKIKFEVSQPTTKENTFWELDNTEGFYVKYEC